MTFRRGTCVLTVSSSSNVSFAKEPLTVRIHVILDRMRCIELIGDFALRLVGRAVPRDRLREARPIVLLDELRGQSQDIRLRNGDLLGSNRRGSLLLASLSE